MKKRVLIICLVITALFLIAAKVMIQKNTLSPSLTENVLVVGTSDDYPPYTFSQNGEVVGFDIDLVREIANRMRCKIEIKVMSFDVLLFELQRGSIQVIAAGLTPTKERALKVFFSSPYIIVDSLKPQSLADVTEKYALAISKKYPELFEKIESALTELLEDGTIDDLKRKWGLV